jgi:hypothetical protein
MLDSGCLESIFGIVVLILEIFPKKVIEGFVYLVVAELRLSCASANPASDVLIGICFLGKQMTVKNLFS